MEEEDCMTAVPSYSGNPLLRAVFLRRLRLTRLLLEGGAYINESDGQGQTPLMVACRTQHIDAQSASRVKLVQYLLERGADPNIQDKAGRSALMHACLEQNGTEVVSLLLASGADPGLKDRSGTSALVYAVTAGDQEVLRLLLDTCKAQGKEVIIIATNTFPCGKLRARQYLNVPPLAQGDKMPLAAPASPSEIDLLTSPQCTSSSSCSLKQVFSFKETKCSGCSGVGSHPCSPSRLRGGLGQGRGDTVQQPLHRLNSEPWLKIPVSLLTQQPHAGPSSTENLPDLSSEEGLSLRLNRLGWNNGHYDDNTPQRCHCCAEQKGSIHSMITSINKSDIREPEEGGRGVQREEVGEGRREGCDPLQHKMRLPGLLSFHSASHPNLHSQSLGINSALPSSSLPASKNLGSSHHSMAISSLHSIIQRRNLGADHYSSDPQLAIITRGLSEERVPPENKRMVTSRSSTLLGSRESLEAPCLPRRVLSELERRGSGALLLDHISQSRPRSLPPLNLHPHPIPNINEGISSNPNSSSRGLRGAVSGLKTFLPIAPPGHPKDLSRRVLLRRHSMQTEQLNQLGEFDGICSH